MKIMKRLRIKLRPYWLVFLRELKASFTACQICGNFVAYPCSICACIPLCDECARNESIKLDRRLHGIS